MTSDRAIWNRLRAEGRWIELWDAVRQTGTVDDLIALAQDLSAEERAADEAARLAWSSEEAVQQALTEAAEHPADRIFERIEKAEGPLRRRQAQAGFARAAGSRGHLSERLSA